MFWKQSLVNAFGVSAGAQLFTAYNSTIGNDTQTVIWTNVTFDSCNCYDNNTGFFTAPADGIYIISVHVGALYNRPVYAQNVLMVLRRSVSDEKHDSILLCAMEFCLCELNAEDNVFIQGSAINSNAHYIDLNTFSGILLKTYK